MRIRTNSKDEREISVENASAKYGYNFISFALLFDVIYRGMVKNEAAWDLLGVIIVSGLVMTLYQHKHKILDKKWIKTIAISSVLACIVAFLIAFLFKMF